MKRHSTRISIVFVEFLVIVFHCPQTTALSDAFHSYIIPSYWVESLVVVRHRRLGLGYLAAISYRLGFFALAKFEAVCQAGTHDVFQAEDRKPVPPHER